MTTSGPAYDTIGVGYTTTRRADPRIAAQVDAALDGFAGIVNVGAGTGSYEPAAPRVVAVEPSPVMIGQRPAGAAPCVRGVAEHLPFADDTFEVGVALLTLHHWTDAEAGLAELERVAPGRQVVLTWDLAASDATWLVTDYLPEIATLSADLACADLVVDVLENARTEVVPVPADCTDGFLGAYWARPAALLDPAVRAGISTFSMIDPAAVDDGLRRLADDLGSGAWLERHQDLLELDALDCGYRLVVAGDA